MDWTTVIHEVHKKLPRGSEAIPLLNSFLIHKFYIEYNISDDINKQLADKRLELDNIRNKLISYIS